VHCIVETHAVVAMSIERMFLGATGLPPNQNLCHFRSLDSLGAKALLSQSQLHKGYFHIFFGCILRNNLEDDVLLVLWNGLFADGFDKFAQPRNIMLAVITVSHQSTIILER
jgi:hypothetical protein